MAAFYRGIAGIHQDKVAGAVGVLDIAALKAGLAEQRRLLVARDAADRHHCACNGGVPVNFGTAAYLGKHAGGISSALRISWSQLRV